MWSKRLFRASALALILALLLALPGFSVGEESGNGTLTLRLRSGDVEHEAFLHGYEDGSFRPNGYITRAEEAQMLYNLLREKPADRAVLADVSEDDWFYDALGLLAAAGVVIPDAAGCVEPKAQLTRAQFVLMLVALFPEQEEASCDFSDLSPADPWYPAVAQATSMGWIKGYEDGTFRAGERITRAEAATIINRALGRSADRDKLAELLVIPLYTDLTQEHWAYYEIMEASIGHMADLSAGSEVWFETDEDALHYAPGPILVGSELYYADDQGLILRDQAMGSLYFGPDGRYTCGDAEADEIIKGILAELSTPGATREELLRAAYEYTRDSFSYLRRSDAYENGATGWEVEEALTLLRTGRGNCYCYAGVFCLLARQLGYDAKAIAGDTNWTNVRPHAWVEIEFDGVPYVFDPEQEMAQKGKYQFYMLTYDVGTEGGVYWPYRK